MILQAEVSSEQAEALSRDLNLRFYRACVKDNLNVSAGTLQALTCILLGLCRAEQSL